jgi:hypothetical protein
MTNERDRQRLANWLSDRDTVIVVYAHREREAERIAVPYTVWEGRHIRLGGYAPDTLTRIGCHYRAVAICRTPREVVAALDGAGGAPHE